MEARTSLEAVLLTVEKKADKDERACDLDGSFPAPSCT